MSANACSSYIKNGIVLSDLYKNPNMKIEE